uniref:Uncharacterized protein n=1 Tax=Anguilla anguilla TaxID=7936 RepID=A0A0E9TSM4_ANGAN
MCSFSQSFSQASPARELIVRNALPGEGDQASGHLSFFASHHFKVVKNGLELLHLPL